MCGRFGFYSTHHAIKEWLDSDDPDVVQPSWNFAPTDTIAAIRADDEGERRLVGLRWGLIPSWAKDTKIGARMINARADTVPTKPAFRTAFRKRRCLIPLDGYYEWQVTSTGKQPYFIHASSPLMAAGLWEQWRGLVGGEPLESATIITTDSVDSLGHVHERMPVFVRFEAHRAWLGHETPPEVLVALLRPYTGDLAITAVSRKVNSVANDGPELILPAEDEASSR